MNDFNFSKNLKEIRISCGKTQKEIVEILHCSLNKYASWEQGRTQPDIDSLRQLCAIFGVVPNDLLGIYTPPHLDD